MKTYILRCGTGEFYCGKTTDINRRMKEHQEGIKGKWFLGRRRKFNLLIEIDGDYEKKIKKFGIKNFVYCTDTLISYDGES